MLDILEVYDSVYGFLACKIIADISFATFASFLGRLHCSNTCARIRATEVEPAVPEIT